MKLLPLIGIVAVMATGASAQTAAEKLNALFQREWDYTMQQSPTWASSLGDRSFNDRWPDISLKAIAARHQHDLDVQKELAAIPRDQLSAADRLNYDLFARNLRVSIEEYPLRWFLVPLTQRDGIQSVDEDVSRWPFATAKDYQDYIQRLNSFPAYMDQTIELMRQGIADKRVQPRVVMQRVPAQIDKQIVVDATTSGFFKPFNTFPAGVDEAERKRLREQAAAAIQDQVVPAYRKFKAFFESEYLPACVDGVGAWRLPDGDRLYAFFARQHTTTDLTPDQIHQMGLEEVARLDAEMLKLMKQLDFKGSKAEFFNHLRTDPKFFYKTGDELLLATRELCKRIDPLLCKLFVTIPRLPYSVEPIPDKLAPDTTTAFYEPGSATGERAGCYRVNLYKPETRPKWEMVALSLHEAVPGHHLQISRAMELGELPKFRQHGGYTAYIEGWALYAESLGDDVGLYSDPYDRFGKITYEMWRAVRLVVDTGIHSKQWSRQQAIDYFMEYAPKTELDVTNEVDRYIAWPGQALAYKVGELRIQAMRRKAQSTLAEKFDLREFNNVLIDQGSLPLDVLETVVDAWIASKKQMPRLK